MLYYYLAWELLAFRFPLTRALVVLLSLFGVKACYRKYLCLFYTPQTRFQYILSLCRIGIRLPLPFFFGQLFAVGRNIIFALFTLRNLLDRSEDVKISNASDWTSLQMFCPNISL